MPTRSSPSNVVALRTAELPEIRWASVHSPGEPIPGSRNEVWLCPAYSGADDLMLFLKPQLTEAQLVSELVAAQIGICMRAPCPRPFLVAVRPEHIGGRRGPARICFGSQQVGRRSMATPIRNLDLMIEALTVRKVADTVAVFDEWIANPVRHTSDILFDPDGGDVWLVDHEAALEASVSPDEAVTNWLAARLAESLQLAERAQFLQALRGRANAAHRASTGRPPPELVRVLNGEQEYQRVMGFLRDRLAHLDALLSQRLLPEQAHIGQNLRETSAPS